MMEGGKEIIKTIRKTTSIKAMIMLIAFVLIFIGSWHVGKVKM